MQPIFQGGKIRNNIKISEYELKRSEIEYIKIAINSIYEADKIYVLTAGAPPTIPLL